MLTGRVVESDGMMASLGRKFPSWLLTSPLLDEQSAYPPPSIDGTPRNRRPSAYSKTTTHSTIYLLGHLIKRE